MSIQVSPAPATTKTTRPDQAAYLVQLLSQRLDLNDAQLSSEAIAWLKELRHQAVAQVQASRLPTIRDEEWRFTDLSRLLSTDFEAASPDLSAVTVDQLTNAVVPDAIAQLVFVDGIYAPALSTVGDLPEGAIVGHLLDQTIYDQIADQLPKYLAQQPSGDVFTALNTAGLTDAAIFWMKRNVELSAPVHVLYVSTSDRPTFSQPRCLAIAEPNSALHLIETYIGLGDGVYYTNPVTEIWAEENATVTHVRVQQDQTDAVHISRTAVTQQRTSRYHLHDISLGAALSRRNLDVLHQGEQVETVLNGLTLANGNQLSDTHSLIDYTQPYGSSRQLHKCIVDDKAHTVFNGKVNVPQCAQMTDAKQLNRCLLLSPKARVDTKPQLEITADNVKCTHGATVSQLDANEVFYFQSRGIDAEQAQSLLIQAFAFEILDEIPVDSIQTRLKQLISSYTR
jgi:Fe-S cluster assembly protein SufD